MSLKPDLLGLTANQLPPRALTCMLVIRPRLHLHVCVCCGRIHFPRQSSLPLSSVHPTPSVIGRVKLLSVLQFFGLKNPEKYQAGGLSSVFAHIFFLFMQVLPQLFSAFSRSFLSCSMLRTEAQSMKTGLVEDIFYEQQC